MVRVKNEDYGIYDNQPKDLELEEAIVKHIGNSDRYDQIDSVNNKLDKTQDVVNAIVSLLPERQKALLARKLGFKISPKKEEN